MGCLPCIEKKISIKSRAKRNDKILIKLITFNAENAPIPPIRIAVRIDLRKAVLIKRPSVVFLEIYWYKSVKKKIKADKAPTPNKKNPAFVTGEELRGLVLKTITNSTPNKTKNIEIAMKNFSVIFL